MGKAAEGWASSIGPVAAATMRRAKRYALLAGLCGGAFPIYVALVVAAGLKTTGWVDTTAGLLSWLWVVGAVVFVIRNVRTLSLAKRQAAEHLGLPPSSAKYLPLRASWLFDTWIAGRDAPTWPRCAPRRYRSSL